MRDSITKLNSHEIKNVFGGGKIEDYLGPVGVGILVGTIAYILQKGYNALKSKKD